MSISCFRTNFWWNISESCTDSNFCHWTVREWVVWPMGIHKAEKHITWALQSDASPLPPFAAAAVGRRESRLIAVVIRE